MCAVTTFEIVEGSEADHTSRVNNNGSITINTSGNSINAKPYSWKWLGYVNPLLRLLVINNSYEINNCPVYITILSNALMSQCVALKQILHE